MRTPTEFAGFLGGALGLGLAVCGTAQVYTVPPPPPVPANLQYVPYPTAPLPAVALTPQQIDQLTAPVALYPDPLLAQLFPAATYPQDVLTAAQWLAANPNVTEQDIAAQNWDPSIKALAHYPSVLQMLAQSLDWTQALGAAFLNQQADVLAAVQRLRAEAQAAGNLRTTNADLVVNDNGFLRIEPANPAVMYVPQYDPNVVYTQPADVGFTFGLPIGIWLDNDFDWRRRDVEEGGGWYHHWHHPEAWDRNPPDWVRRAPEGYWQRHEWSGANHAVMGPDTGPPAAVQTWHHDPQRPAPQVAPETVRRALVQRPVPQPAAAARSSGGAGPAPAVAPPRTAVSPGAPARMATPPAAPAVGRPAVPAPHALESVRPTPAAPAAPRTVAPPPATPLGEPPRGPTTAPVRPPPPRPIPPAPLPQPPTPAPAPPHVSEPARTLPPATPANPAVPHAAAPVRPTEPPHAVAPPAAEPARPASPAPARVAPPPAVEPVRPVVLPPRPSESAHPVVPPSREPAPVPPAHAAEPPPHPAEPPHPKEPPKKEG